MAYNRRVAFADRSAYRAQRTRFLPVIAASLLCGGNGAAPTARIWSDVDAAMDILRYLGCTAALRRRSLHRYDRARAVRYSARAMHRMRSSRDISRPLLARFGRGGVSPRRLRARPRLIDLHLPCGFWAREIEEGEDSIVCWPTAPSRRGDIACAAERRRNGKRHDRRLRGGGDDRHL